MDLDDLQRWFTWGAIVSFTIALVALLGEVFHWWNDLGEIALSLGTVIGVLLTIMALLLNATKGQVRTVAHGVVANGEKLDILHEDMGHLRNGMVGLNEGMGRLNDGMGTLHGEVGGLREDMVDVKGLLVQIRDRL